MKLCFDLLKRPSGSPWDSDSIRRIERRCLRIAGVSIFLDVGQLVSMDEKRKMYGESKQIVLLARKRQTERNARSLVKARAKWRERIICNDKCSPRILKKTRSRQTYDFDAYALTKIGEFRIDPDKQSRRGDMPNFQIHTNWKRVGTRQTAAIKPVAEDFLDIFDWLFLRASLNFQLSRFAHCCVCDRWEMKRFAGKRSAAVAEWIAAMPRLKELSPGDIPRWVTLLPMWPAVCHRPKCKNAFQHLVRGNTPNATIRFRGLLDSPNSGLRNTLDMSS